MRKTTGQTAILELDYIIKLTPFYNMLMTFHVKYLQKDPLSCKNTCSRIFNI